MNRKLYIGNLSYSTTEEELRQLFAQFGELESAIVITDRITGRSKGFGFVEFKTEADAEKALSLDGQDFNERQIKVSEARPMRKDF